LLGHYWIGLKNDAKALQLAEIEGCRQIGDSIGRQVNKFSSPMFRKLRYLDVSKYLPRGLAV
jgi:hypothetical protein